MTKKQRIWLWVFIAMFAVPEILWSPVANFIYSFLKAPVNGTNQLFRNNFLFDYKNENLLKAIVLVQLIGPVSFFVFWLKNKKNIKSQLTFVGISLISLLVCLLSLFVFYLAFIFSPSFP